MYPVRAIKTTSVAFRVLSETKSIRKLRGTVLVDWDDGQQPAEAKLLDFGTQRAMEQKRAQLAKVAVALASSHTEKAAAETQKEVMAQRFFTLEAAIDLLFSLPDDEREGASVCQLPPVEDVNLTDEEHVNENNFSEVVPVDVCGHVEVMQCSDEDVDLSSACSSPEPRRKKPAGRQFTAGKGREAPKNARKTNTSKRFHTPVWGEHATFGKTLPSESPPLLLEAFPDLANMSPFMLFSKFISPEYLGLLAELTARYALQKEEVVDVTGADIGWLLHCEIHRGSDAAMTHIAFRRDVTMSLLQLKQKLTVRSGPWVHPRYEARNTDGHYITSTTQGRCAECKKNTTNQCQQCKKLLHKKGFAAYHGL
ncbi:hypothetical protein MRX96_045732 [Rhipicephalus microplus]